MKATDWKRIDSGALVGTFSLVLDSGMILHECCLFSKEGKRFVTGPSRKLGTGAGAKYQRLVDFNSKAIADKFGALALAAVEPLAGIKPTQQDALGL